MFNHVMKLVICWRYNLVIPAEYITVYTGGKHGIQCSEDCVNSIITNYGPKTVYPYVFKICLAFFAINLVVKFYNMMALQKLPMTYIW